MLKFFRRIRQQLFIDGNLRKYFFYAIGELLLIIFGILIALYFNNLNTQKQLNQKEQEYYQRLQTDLKNELASIKQINTSIQMQRSCMINHLKYFYNQKAYNKDSIIATGNCVKIDFIGFNSPHLTLKELEQTGNLILLNRKGIKEAILLLANIYEQITWREQAEKEKLDRIFSSLLIEGHMVMNQSISLKFNEEGIQTRTLTDLEVKNWFNKIKTENFIIYENYILSKDLSFTLRENLYGKAKNQIEYILSILN